MPAHAAAADAVTVAARAVLPAVVAHRRVGHLLARGLLVTHRAGRHGSKEKEKKSGA